jgi:hypothetical protein
VNLTRRVLLLSESRAISGALVRERVIRNVLARYVVHDRSVPRKDGRPYPIPHFLLNDVIRYWRTIAIQDVGARAEGMACAKLFPTASLSAAETSGSEEEYLRLLAELIREQTDVSPLELLARVVQQVADPEIARAIFGSYDDFLHTLRDEGKRKQLESVRFEDAWNDPVYDGLRTRSTHFKSGVDALFFDQHTELRTLIRQYGVF